MTPCKLQRACIWNSQGVTLLEMIVVMMITGVGMLGLVVVYVTGIDIWLKTEKKISLQQNGSYALEEIAVQLQRAQAISLLKKRIVVHFVHPDSQVVIEHRNHKLWIGSRQIIPLAKWEDKINLQNMVIERNVNLDTYDIRLTLRLLRENQIEDMVFRTSIYNRNELSTYVPPSS